MRISNIGREGSGGEVREAGMVSGSPALTERGHPSDGVEQLLQFL